MYVATGGSMVAAIHKYPVGGLFPVLAPSDLRVCWRGRLPSPLWPELVADSKNRSLRDLARRYGVSHETVRRLLRSKDVIKA